MRDTNLALELLLRQFLAELAAGPRGYAATMEAWRTHCPRLAVWEEATERGLVTLSPGRGGMREIEVALSDAGRAVLAAD
jgi:D-3-phosphoglycerate dehydrogenase